MTNNPYVGLPDAAFWSRAVASQPLCALDPMHGTPIRPQDRIGRATRIATAGSCFAQHIAMRLQAQGYNYFVTEEAPPGMEEVEARARNYRVFSGRYGNVYTARQLRQLLERAYGRFTPQDVAWERPDGRFVDPFRPRIEPAGFASVAEVVLAREAHLHETRRLFEELDVFVFTLGLTEGWQAKGDGAAFPLCPGVAGGVYDPDRYGFVNAPVHEVVADLAAFADAVKAVNPRARFILTVSPVPLVATFERRHVLQSTVLSKAVLRVAAQSVVDARDDAAYFPSYEIITSTEGGARYFESDLRSINEVGVDHVMRVFFRNLTEGAGHAAASRAPLHDLSLELRRQRAVVCDEEALQPRIEEAPCPAASSSSATARPKFWRTAWRFCRRTPR